MKLPKHLKMTDRKFRAWKRSQFKQVCSYINKSDITFASAYLPEAQFQKLIKGIALINEARDDLKKWWKKA